MCQIQFFEAYRKVTQLGFGDRIPCMKRSILSLAVGIAIPIVVCAHHSLPGAYDTNRQVIIEGVITRFYFVNPHPYVTMVVNQDGGSSQQWRLEMDNRRELADIGMNGDSLRPGDRIVVSGNPAHENAPGLYVRKLERSSDGLLYEQPGMTPSIRFPRNR